MKRGMTGIVGTVLALTCLMLSAGPTLAQGGPVENVLEACESEIETYCSQVTLGDGRLLACFVAHEDKISGQCGWALYEAMAEFDAFANAVAYVATSCWDDIEEHCAEVEMGEGRVATCLLDNKEKVTPQCSQAMEDVELEVVEE